MGLGGSQVIGEYFIGAVYNSQKSLEISKLVDDLGKPPALAKGRAGSPRLSPACWGVASVSI